MDKNLPEDVQRAIAVLAEAETTNPIVQARLTHLKQALSRLLSEIQDYERVLSCGDAVGCLLQSGVLRVFAGSRVPREKWWGKRSDWLIETGIVARDAKGFVFIRDFIFHAPSPAAEVVLGRKANGMEEWKDKQGRSINAMRK